MKKHKNYRRKNTYVHMRGIHIFDRFNVALNATVNVNDKI